MSLSASERRSSFMPLAPWASCRTSVSQLQLHYTITAHKIPRRTRRQIPAGWVWDHQLKEFKIEGTREQKEMQLCWGWDIWQDWFPLTGWTTSRHVAKTLPLGIFGRSGALIRLVVGAGCAWISMSFFSFAKRFPFGQNGWSASMQTESEASSGPDK